MTGFCSRRRAPSKTPETKEFFNKLGEDPYPGDRNLVARLHAEETTAWREYVKLAKIEPM